jgi:hypothetical protein
MFYWNKDKKEIHEALQSLQADVDFLNLRSNTQSNIIQNLVDRLDSYERATKYGLKKDGTPKAKPGRKAGI